MFYVYAIKNEKDKIYIGYTSNLENRLERHNGVFKNKKTSYTSKNKGKWSLVFAEEYEVKKDALKREKQLKGYQGRKFIRDIINRN